MSALEEMRRNYLRQDAHSSLPEGQESSPVFRVHAEQLIMSKIAFHELVERTMSRTKEKDNE